MSRTQARFPKLFVPLAAAFVMLGAAAAVLAGPAVDTRAGAATTPAPDKVLGRLQRRYQETKSFRAKFSEEIAPAGGVKRVRAGTVYYRKPGRMRWEFGGGRREIVVSDGTTLYTYQEELNQVIETPLERAFSSSSAVSFLLGIGNLGRDFDASVPANPPPDGLTHISLRPKAGGDAIELGLDPETADLRTLRLTDQLGDVTLLRLADFQRDIALDDSLFVFKAPSGTDIVEAPPGP